MKSVLAIAGSDCSGGAGIQADIKTITVHRMYAMSVVTALTAQNTTGVYGIQDVSAEMAALQMDCVFKDIRPDAVKIGMVCRSQLIHTIADRLTEYQAEHVVLDPVMISTSGSCLLEPSAMEVLMDRLLPLADLVTPNLPEAEKLCGFAVLNREDMIKAARSIARQTGRAVLIKGGHAAGDADDLLFIDGRAEWFKGPRIGNVNTHGTGCTLSSAIACNLAAGVPMDQSVRKAKAYVAGAIRAGLDLGKGRGPLNHGYCI
jgi:hydroxymethylpyrimidine/phosphomethylpyrimidine kinase